jgi:hypothetical protein
VEGIGAGGDVDQAGQCADAGALVAAAGLVPAVDEDDPELRIIAVEFAHPAQVARLDRAAAGCVGEHRSEREHRHDGHAPSQHRRTYSGRACLAFSASIRPDVPGPGQESVWDYPRRRASSRCPCV